MRALHDGGIAWRSLLGPLHEVSQPRLPRVHRAAGRGVAPMGMGSAPSAIGKGGRRAGAAVSPSFARAAVRPSSGRAAPRAMPPRDDQGQPATLVFVRPNSLALHSYPDGATNTGGGGGIKRGALRGHMQATVVWAKIAFCGFMAAPNMGATAALRRVPRRADFPDPHYGGEWVRPIAAGCPWIPDPRRAWKVESGPDPGQVLLGFG